LAGGDGKAAFSEKKNLNTNPGGRKDQEKKKQQGSARGEEKRTRLPTKHSDQVNAETYTIQAGSPFSWHVKKKCRASGKGTKSKYRTSPGLHRWLSEGGRRKRAGSVEARNWRREEKSNQ